MSISAAGARIASAACFPEPTSVSTGSAYVWPAVIVLNNDADEQPIQERFFMYFTEDELKTMAAPLSPTEDEQCKRAIRMVADALKDIGYSDTSEIKRLDPLSPSYSIRMVKRYRGEDIQLLIQGSYANNTNVRGESDVDIAVIDESNKVYGARKNTDTNEYLFANGDTGAYAANLLRASVKRALCGRFAGVKDGDKSIKVPGNASRKSADVVPCVRFVDLTNYREDGTGKCIDGVVLHSLSAETIVNYPEAHIAAGRHKNTRTDRWYKKMVRIEKHIRCELCDEGYPSAMKLSSFGVESLVFNVPDSTITSSLSYRSRFKAVVDWLYEHRYSLMSFTEANGIKLLCPEYSTRQNYVQFIETVHALYTA